MVGNTETGDQVAFCVPCYARQGLESAKAVLPAEEIAAALGPMFVQQPAEAASTSQDAPGRPKRKKATEDTQAPERSASGPPEVAAAAEDT
jgi:hypothetical protein